MLEWSPEWPGDCTPDDTGFPQVFGTEVHYGAYTVTSGPPLIPKLKMDSSTSNRIEDLIRERLRLDQELERYQRLLTILFVDIAGSTRFYDEHGNTAGLLMVQKCLDLLIPIVEKHSGTVVKTIGDAILARFEKVEEALRAAIEMVRTLEQRNRGRAHSDELHIHVGLNYGLCLLKDNDVFGDVVNVAARIESEAGLDEIIISPSVYEETRQLHDIRVRKKSSGVELKGKSSRLDLYTVLWRPGDISQPVLPAPPPPSPDQLAMATGVHANFHDLAKQLGRAPAGSTVPAASPSHFKGRFALARVRHDGSLEHTQPLDRPGIVAGQKGEIPLTGDPLVAAQHVRFTQLGDQVFVEDMGSPRGVYMRIRSPHPLEEGDMFQIGEQLMRFHGAAHVPYLARLNGHEQEVQRYELRDSETSFGRSKGTHTFAEDPYLSSRHAAIKLLDRRYVLEDVGSTNGTFVKLRKRGFARDGDTLLIGKQLMRLVLEGTA